MFDTYIDGLDELGHDPILVEDFLVHCNQVNVPGIFDLVAKVSFAAASSPSHR
jgi:hypothetical protein